MVSSAGGAVSIDSTLDSFPGNRRDFARDVPQWPPRTRPEERIHAESWTPANPDRSRPRATLCSTLVLH
jgi:hypothetical protein